jgi:hypothetical protein
LRWWEDGKLKPLIAKTFSLVEAGLALDALVSRRYAGCWRPNQTHHTSRSSCSCSCGPPAFSLSRLAIFNAS